MKVVVLLIAVFLSVKPCVGGEIAYAAEEAELPILMYHSVLNSKKGVYIVSEKQLESDILALKAAGYESVLPSELVKFVEGTGDLPEKPILITFDDGHYNNLFYAVPIFERLGFKAVFNVIGSFSEYSSSSGDSGNPNYSHLTWDEIAELAKSPNFEIGHHTYALHKYKPRFGVSRLYNESEEQYSRIMTEDLLRLNDILRDKCEVTPMVFAYPFGRHNELFEKILRENDFKITLTCREGINLVERGNKESLCRLKRFNRSGKYSTEKIMDLIDGD